ncbi:helix-turn-helix transcriptional regulator [Fructobacillus cardui]|uniref:helix-turn-helix domain-containing protein n=1 Tax=Fructobacillus cardui TaxID=2893170 RepID=UPI0030C7BB46
MKQLRKELKDIPKSRIGFIEDRSIKLFNNEEWISEKTLCNYELGKNIPSIENLVMLAAALEVDKKYLFEEVTKRIDSVSN